MGRQDPDRPLLLGRQALLRGPRGSAHGRSAQRPAGRHQGARQPSRRVRVTSPTDRPTAAPLRAAKHDPAPGKGRRPEFGTCLRNVTLLPSKGERGPQAKPVATDSEAVVREGLSSVTKGTLFVLVSTLLLVALNFVARVVIVRSVSPADWSAFSFGLTVSWVMVAVGTLGLPTALARNLPYASSDAERRTIIRGALWIGGAAALVSSALLFVFAPAI